MPVCYRLFLLSENRDMPCGGMLSFPDMASVATSPCFFHDDGLSFDRRLLRREIA